MGALDLGRVVGIIAAVVLLVGALVFFLFRYTFTTDRLYTVQTAVGIDAPSPERHIVPEGFRGWAVIHYGVEGAPELEMIEGIRVARYPMSGQLETSTVPPEDEGFINQDFFEQQGADIIPLSRLGKIWGEYNMVEIRDDTGHDAGRSSGFFVGSLAEFRASERPDPVPEILDLQEVPQSPE